jgi:hypothetical protein
MPFLRSDRSFVVLVGATAIVVGTLTALGVAAALLIAGAVVFLCTTLLIFQPVPSVVRTGAPDAPLIAADGGVASGIGARTRAMWAGSLVVFLLVIIDVPGILLRGPAWRYAIVLVVPVAVLLAGTSETVRICRPTVADRYLIALIGCGLVGSMYGKFVLHSSSPAMALFVPMMLGLVHLLVGGRLDEPSAQRYLGVLAGLGVLYAVAHAAASVGVLDDAVGSYTHEKAFLLAIALAAVWLRRNPGLFVLLVGLAAVIFTTYAAGTYPAVLVTAVLTLLATGRGASRARPYVIAFMVALVLFFAFSQMSRSESLAGSYFQSVGKKDNTSTRRQFWDASLEQIKRSPVVGSAFAGDISVEGVLPNPIPPHNDFLSIAMLGGIVGLSLVTGWLVSANRRAVRHYRQLVEAGEQSRAQLLRLLLVGLNSFAVSALFNPLLAKAGLCAAFFLLYALMQTVAPVEDEAR